MMTMSIVPKDDHLINLIGALNAIGTGMGFKNTERALGAVTNAIAYAWRMALGRNHIVEVKKNTPFSYTVFSRDKVVHWLEYGLEPYDMKKTHPFGKKSRVVKPRIGPKGKIKNEWKQKRKDGSEYTVHAGDSYLIIPFRHKTTGDKNKGDKVTLAGAYKDVRNMMKEEDFERSYVTVSASESDKVEPNHWGDQIARTQYNWGSRLSFPEEKQFSQLQGMVVMGGPRQSQFMTFRVVSVNSPAESWMHPGIEAKHYLDNIINKGHEQINTVVEEALKKDLQI